SQRHKGTRRARAQCRRTPTACRAAHVSPGLCKSIRPGCIRFHAPDTLLLTDRPPPVLLWFHEAWTIQTILLSFELRFPAARPGPSPERGETGGETNQGRDNRSYERRFQTRDDCPGSSWRQK